MGTEQQRRRKLREKGTGLSTDQKLARQRADFLKRYRFSEEQFKQTGLEWPVLDQVRERHTRMLNELQTAAMYVAERLQAVPAVHSLKTRIKDGEHLVAKIIRKKCARPEFVVDCTTYEESITDLVGVRALHLFKDDWRAIHDFVSTTWELHETPVAYVRAGDGDPQGFADAGCKVETHPFGYRSIHYVIKFQPDKCVRLVELQVRTIFEEGWSEIDHRVRYPRQSDDPQLAFFLTIFNRLAGSADEMGTFTKMLDAYLRENARQIQGKEAELQNTISQLKITKEAKESLQRQIIEINKPQQQRAELGAFNSLQHFSKILEASQGSAFQRFSEILKASRSCRSCGKEVPGLSNAIGASLVSPICPDCERRGALRDAPT